MRFDGGAKSGSFGGGDGGGGDGGGGGGGGCGEGGGGGEGYGDGGGGGDKGGGGEEGGGGDGDGGFGDGFSGGNGGGGEGGSGGGEGGDNSAMGIARVTITRPHTNKTTTQHTQQHRKDLDRTPRSDGVEEEDLVAASDASAPVFTRGMHVRGKVPSPKTFFGLATGSKDTISSLCIVDLLPSTLLTSHFSPREPRPLRADCIQASSFLVIVLKWVINTIHISKSRLQQPHSGFSRTQPCTTQSSFVSK